MKFDVAIMNPPYNRDLHLDILQEVMKNCDKVVNISPIRKYLSIRNIWCEKAQKEYEGLPGREHLELLQEIPRSVCSNLFGGLFFQNRMGIQVFDTTRTFDNTDPWTFVDLKENKDLIRKIMDKCCQDPVSVHTTGPYIFRYSRIHGNIDTDNFLNIFAKTWERQLETTGKLKVGFDTEQDAKDFYDFWMSKYGRILTSLWKTDTYVIPDFVPYFWSTKGNERQDIKDYFGLTDEECDELLSLEQYK